MINFEHAINSADYEILTTPWDRHNPGRIDPEALRGHEIDILLPGRGNDNEISRDRARYGGLVLSSLELRGNIVSCGSVSPGNAPSAVTEAFELDQVLEKEVNPYLLRHGRQVIQTEQRKLEDKSKTSASNVSEARVAGFIGERAILVAAQQEHAIRMLRTVRRQLPWIPSAALIVPEDPMYPDRDGLIPQIISTVTMLPILPKYQTAEGVARNIRIMDKIVWTIAKPLLGAKSYNQSDKSTAKS